MCTRCIEGKRADPLCRYLSCRCSLAQSFSLSLSLLPSRLVPSLCSALTSLRIGCPWRRPLFLSSFAHFLSLAALNAAALSCLSTLSRLSHLFIPLKSAPLRGTAPFTGSGAMEGTVWVSMRPQLEDDVVYAWLRGDDGVSRPPPPAPLLFLLRPLTPPPHRPTRRIAVSPTAPQRKASRCSGRSR